jgi:very-short-patch-repair endonuclease
VTGEFKPRNTARAKALRNQATPAERLLWTALSNRQVDGYKFSRQMPVGPYFADFLCREARLVVELDGYSHDTRQEHDRQRDAFMKAEGYRVMRIANADVMTNLDGVAQTIAMALAETDPPPAQWSLSEQSGGLIPPLASGRGLALRRVWDDGRSNDA